MEKEIKKTILTVTSKSIKYLGIHLTKKMKALYTENCALLFIHSSIDG